MNIKYIVFDTGLCHMIVVFPGVAQHRDFRDLPWEVVSAGFVKQLDDGSWQCYGESISLGVKSRPEDTALANRQLGMEDWA